MIQYIYFVKCPDCTDEHFDFFDEAKGFALGCLSKKPIITQVEVDRNDFGECTDSNDLGMIWSWEDECTDCQEPTSEPATFTKDDVAVNYDPDNDSEFADDSLEAEDDDFRAVNAVEEVRKPIPEGMTIEELVEEMEENEDMVECTWCDELYDKADCKFEIYMGWLCPKCQAAIKSRGEVLTFRENSYKDPLDEAAGRDPFDHHDPDYSDEEAADALADEIDRAWDSRYDDAIDDYFNEDFDDPVSEDEDSEEESIFDNAESVEEVVDILVKDEEEAIAAYEEAADKIEELASEEDIEETQEVLDHIKEEEKEHIEELEELLTEESEEQDTDTLDEHINEEHPAIESDQKLDGIDNAVVDCEVADVIAHSEDEKPVDCKGEKKPLEKPLTEENETLEVSPVSKIRLAMCPECGAENAFDYETGICNNCGFMI